MSLVLSNAFKGLLLSSYVNIRYDLAVKSLQDLIDNPSIKIIYDRNSLRYIKYKTPELIKLLKMPHQIRTETINIFTKQKDIAKYRNGQAVIICNSVNCPFFIALNPQIQFVYTNDHKFHTFGCMRVSESHSHSKQIYKL